MNKDEEIISNISYCNNDFRTIYPQLLDTAKKLTNKWDPSLSNESDPGNILIKEAAIVGDKVNYHIDKNVLECFPLSATQQSSARQIYDLVGYNMHWYKSAECTINFTLLKEPTSIDASLTYIQVPTGKVISDSTSEYVYTLLSPSPMMTKLNTIYSAPAIQGIINTYEINGDKVITMNSLDENLRLYFPQNVIAENGIFVYNKLADGQDTPTNFANNILDNESNQWMLVDNLAKYPSGSKVFKFGLDLNSDNCYIQFPEDIGNLIDAGLNIFYTTTMGNDGNIKSGILNKFLTNFDVTINDSETITINDNIVINNTASIGGADPETLQQAYRNYKKLIGTYDTLVTRRDYENAIYNLENETNTNSLISNVLVTDRTTDMNYSQKVIETNLDTDYAKNYVVQENSQDIMKPYDISLYLLKAPSSMLSVDNYNESFEPDLDGTTKILIEDDIDGIKSIQHNIYYIPQISENSDIDDLYFNVRNICRLNGTLTTYYKVSKLEATEIENNVVKQLISTYNARAIDFGNSLDYDDLIATIKSADDRIRNVSLITPAYEPTMVFANGETKSLYNTDNTNINNKTLAKMILAGKVQLFSFDDDFNYDFGQSNGTLFQDIESIQTENPIVINVSSDENDLDNATPLEENDIVQIVAPNLVPKSTFNATVGVKANFPISTNETICLTNGQSITFYYYDSATNNPAEKTLNQGAIIKSNGFEYTQENADNDYTKYIPAGQSIEELIISNITIKNGTPYYVITNKVINDEYVLDLSSTDTILGENEYFLYTNSTLDGLIILGSGTTIKTSNGSSLTLKSKVLELDEILATNIGDASTIWGKLPQDLIAQENTIVNLTQGDKVIALSSSSTSTITCSNDLKDISDSSISSLSIIGFKYKIKDLEEPEKITIPTGMSSYTIKFKSNMILIGNSVVPQILKGEQRITIQGTLISATTNPETALLYNYPINIAGGNNVNVQVLNETTGKYESLLAIFAYEKISATDSPFETVTRSNNGLLTITAKDIVSTLNFTFNQTHIDQPIGDWYLLPTSFTTPNNAKIILSLPQSSGKIDTYLNVYNNNADNVYEATSTQNQILTIKDDTNINSYLGISLGYIYDDTVANKITINDVEFSYTGTLGSSGTISYIDNGTTYTYTYSSGLYVRGADLGYIKIDTINQLAQFYDTEILSNLVTDMSSVSVTFGYIQRINGLNSDEINSENIAGSYYTYDIYADNNIDSVIAQISTILNNINANYDWSYKVPASSKVLQPISGESYFNTNHIYNLCTIAKIDFENSGIKVNPASIK